MSQKFKYTFLAVIFWALMIIIAKYIYLLGGNVYNVTFWSTVMSSPFWLVMLFRRKAEFRKISLDSLFILLGMGLISSVGVVLTEALALKYSQAINYSFLIRTVILFTFLFAAIFLKEKITLKKLVLAVVILGGAYLLTTNGKNLVFARGDIFTLVEAALIAFGNTVLGKLAVQKMPPLFSAAAASLIGIIPLVIIAGYNQAIYWPATIGLIFLWTIAFILLTLMRFTAYQYASAAYLTMMYSLTPVLVSLMALTLLQEEMTALQIVGGGLIVLAGVGVEKLKI